MATYRFPKEHTMGVIEHIEAFDFTILSMSPDGNNYIIEVNNTIEEKQLNHLIEAYQLEEIV